jgi:hypothetical protein
VDTDKFYALAERCKTLLQKYDQLGYSAKKFREEEEATYKELMEARKEFHKFINDAAGFKIG